MTASDDSLPAFSDRVAAFHDAIQPEKVSPDGAEKGEEPAEGCFHRLPALHAATPLGLDGRWDEAIPG